MRQKKKKKENNDLIIPILLILAVLPFVTRLILYDSGLSIYPWFSNSGFVSDFFTYYKSYLFIVISLISALILIVYLPLHRGTLKGMKPFLFLGIYSFTVLLSTIFSVDYHISMVGGLARFESFLVLVGYAIIILYAYQIEKTEEDYNVLIKTLLISLFLMCIIGIFQMLGKDILAFHWMQKIIIPRQYQNDYLGKIENLLSTNAVSLTLFNPNHASTYIAMMIPFLTALMLPFTNNKKTLGYLTLISILLILLFKTYSRSGLLSLFVSFLILGYFYRMQLRKIYRQCLIVLTLCILLFIGLDSLSNYRYIEKIYATFVSLSKGAGEFKLEDIQTTQNHVYIRYKEQEISVAFTNQTTSSTSLIFFNAAGKEITNHYNLDSKTMNIKPFDEIIFSTEVINHDRFLICKINNISWRFYHNINGYQYVNDFGKLDQLNKVEKYGFQNSESIGSGRGFIWSRSIPLLKSTLILGKGPDTYSIVFPQSDYVGKANNCKTPYTMIEKPHNMYLMTGIQTGVLSLISALCFYFIYFFHSFRLYKTSNFTSYTEKIGIGCLLATISFMVSGLFNDSSLQTTPVFCVFLGLGMDINHKMKTVKIQSKI